MAKSTTSATNTNSKQEVPSAFSLFGPSWERIKFNLDAFLALGIVPLALSVILSIQRMADHASTLNTAGNHLPASYAILTLITAIATLAVAPALLLTQVKSAQSIKITASEALRDSWGFFWRFYGLAILVGLIVCVGLILLIVPGIFMIKRYLLSPYFLVDKNLGILDAMKHSAETSKEHGGAIWGLIGVEILIAMLNVIPLIGWIANWVGIVTYYCAPAIRYEQLKKLKPAAGKSRA